MPPLRRFLVLLFMLALAGVACAHDALENTLELRITADGLEITALLSNPSVSGLLTPPADGPITKATFPNQRATLLAAAGRVCTLVDASGENLPPARTHVSFLANGEVRYLFQYPATTPASVLKVDLLSALAAGYFVEVTDRTVEPLRRVVLVRGHLTCPLALPVAARSP